MSTDHSLEKSDDIDQSEKSIVERIGNILSKGPTLWALKCGVTNWESGVCNAYRTMYVQLYYWYYVTKITPSLQGDPISWYYLIHFLIFFCDNYQVMC